jgi:hypothetical protein
MSMGRVGVAGSHNSVSGKWQDAVIKDQKQALREGFDWTPMGWADTSATSGDATTRMNTWGSTGTQSGMGQAAPSPTLISANHQQRDYDPWSAYRAAAGEKLNADMNAGDPSDVYRGRIEQMLTGNGADFATSDPSYQFRFEQGKKATERSLAAKGLLNSGNAAAAMSDYGQQSASQEFQAQFGRLMQGMDGVSKQYDVQQQRLMKMAGIDNDPAMAAKLNLQAEGINTDRMNSANNYALGVRGDETNRYGIDTKAATDRASTASNRSTSFDTKSMFAGQAADAVRSANWWDGQENTSSSLGFFGNNEGTNSTSTRTGAAAQGYASANQPSWV